MLFGTKLTYGVAQSHDNDVIEESHVTQNLTEGVEMEGMEGGGCVQEGKNRACHPIIINLQRQSVLPTIVYVVFSF